MLVDQLTAKKLVEDYLARLAIESGHRMSVIDDLTKDLDYGWLFYYDSELYLQTKERRHRLIGNGPIIIEKESGRISHLPTGVPVEKSLSEFEAVRSKRTMG